jgi:hypothetical protein
MLCSHTMLIYRVETSRAEREAGNLSRVMSTVYTIEGGGGGDDIRVIFFRRLPGLQRSSSVRTVKKTMTLYTNG